MISREVRGIEPITAAGALALTASLVSPGRWPLRPSTAALPAAGSRGIKQLNFEITRNTDNVLFARCRSRHISTQADTWSTLRASIKQAARAYCFQQPKHRNRIRLHIVRDEMFALR